MTFSKEAMTTVAFAGFQLVSLSASTKDPTVLEPRVGGAGAKGETQALTAADARAIEGSHLEIYAACKWGRAAFAPQKDTSSTQPAHVAQIYHEMMSA